MHRAVGLLIVDSVGLASPAARDGADAAEGALRLFDALRHLRGTKLLLDHVAKVEGHGPSRPYGSVYKGALARSTYELRAAEQPDEDGSRHLGLFHRKQNTTAGQAPTGIRVYRSDEEVLLTWEPIMLSDPKLAHGATLVERIKDALRSGRLSVEAIAAATEASEAVVRKVLARHDGLFISFPQPGEKTKLWGMRAHP